MKSFKWMIAAGIMLIGIVLLSMNYSNGTLNASPVKTTVQPTNTDQDLLESDFPLYAIGLRLYILY